MGHIPVEAGHGVLGIVASHSPNNTGYETPIRAWAGAHFNMAAWPQSGTSGTVQPLAQDTFGRFVVKRIKKSEDKQALERVEKHSTSQITAVARPQDTTR